MNRLRQSQWLRHPRVWLVIGVLGWLLGFAWAIFDYSPATIIPDLTDTGLFVPAGTTIRFSVPVERRLGKRCSLDTQRKIVDSSKGITELGIQSHTSWETLVVREAQSPGMLRLNIRVPVDTIPGPTTVVTENRYRCLWNPLTWIVPIDDSWTVKFTVLPAKEGVIIVN